MSKIIRLTEQDLVRLVKRVINEDENLNSTSRSGDSSEQKLLFDFLQGILEISPYNTMGVGWIPYNGSGTKLTPNLLGPYFNKYTRDVYGRVVKPNQSLSWNLFPLNPDKFPKAEGVSCDITGGPGKLYIDIKRGNRLAAMGSTEGGGFLKTPGVVEKTLKTLEKIFEIYKAR